MTVDNRTAQKERARTVYHHWFTRLKVVKVGGEIYDYWILQVGGTTEYGEIAVCCVLHV
jgi:hypothetical protein